MQKVRYTRRGGVAKAEAYIRYVEHFAIPPQRGRSDFLRRHQKMTGATVQAEPECTAGMSRHGYRKPYSITTWKAADNTPGSQRHRPHNMTGQDNITHCSRSAKRPENNAADTPAHSSSDSAQQCRPRVGSGTSFPRDAHGLTQPVEFLGRRRPEGWNVHRFKDGITWFQGKNRILQFLFQARGD